MICAGIDAGSRLIKAVLLDAVKREVLSRGLVEQGVEQDEIARGLMQRLADEAGISLDEIERTVATGYGRNIVSFANTRITEITCHASGVRHTSSDAMTIVDIGGQDSKVIRLAENGAVRDFAMNDRCAAGTGRFLEVAAERLGVGLDALGELAEKSKTPAGISSMCAVFAETEIIGLLASGIPRHDIVAGVQESIASRVATMAGRDLKEPVIFTGGVALVPGMSRALEKALGRSIRVAEQPQMTGALGAALLAADYEP